NASSDAPRRLQGSRGLRDAERPGLHAHAERGNDLMGEKASCSECIRALRVSRRHTHSPGLEPGEQRWRQCYCR
ncbi:hypothetical protein DJ480_24270, partial [Pseudomonas sp. Leaf98]